MIDIGTALRHYKRREIQEEMILAAENKEVAVKYGEQFGSRPDTLNYPREILELAQKGATSFHCSEELWSNPMQLSTTMSRQEAEQIRTGWDLVIDVDCAFIEYSKITSDETVKLLKMRNISAISAKFSGNKGFHIGVPFESLPAEVAGKETRMTFPEAARIIAAYIKEEIKDNVRERLLEKENNDLSSIREKTGKDIQPENRVTAGDTWETAKLKLTRYIESFLNIDTVLISSRHLYRMPYSLHEKSGLVSLPIDPDRITGFEKEKASPEKASVSEFRFLDRAKAGRNEAKELVDSAYYLHIQATRKLPNKEENAQQRYSDTNTAAIPADNFPPCIQKILAGLEDGKKRGLFVLLNFLGSVNWDHRDIEKLIKEWNSRNKPPLGEPYVQGQIAHYKQRKTKILPPNCNNTGYYSDMGIKCDEGICSRCKNPVVYAKRRMKQ